MQTDKELLELAARAAGIEHGADRMECGLSLTEPDGRHRHLPQWNPLTDDGDALRLAIRLKIDLDFRFSRVVAYGSDYSIIREIHGDDEGAATRRAIVRAAAAIGEKMP